MKTFTEEEKIKNGGTIQFRWSKDLIYFSTISIEINNFLHLKIYHLIVDKTVNFYTNIVEIKKVYIFQTKSS